MPAVTSQAASAAREAEVLSKAVTRAAERLGVSQGRLARILGVSAASVSRLYSGRYRLDARRKEWELALLFVRAFRSLDSIVGNDEAARAWLNSENSGLNSRPAELIDKTEGLVRVVRYLDASRGRI
jgi:transcriptional regulator with XRE-family HTH domain